jgi:hypothetical protein
MQGYQTPMMRIATMLSGNTGDNTHNRLKQSGYGNEQSLYDYMKALNALQARQQESHAFQMTPQQRVQDLRSRNNREGGGDSGGGGLMQMLPLLLMAMG